MKPTWSVPSGWPIVDNGLLLAGLGEVMFIYTDENLTDLAFERHLRELRRAIERAQPRKRIGVLYETAGSQGQRIETERRQQVRALLLEHRQTLRQTTAAFAMVSPSLVVRGILTAVFWFQRSPYPMHVASDVRGGLQFLATQVPGLDVEGVHAAWINLKRESASKTSWRPGPASSA